MTYGMAPWASRLRAVVPALLGSLLASFGLGACGLSHTVDRELLSDLSIEYKLQLFDAENDVSIAMDERENIRAQIREVKRDITDARAQIVEAESDELRAKEKGDEASVTLAEQAMEVFELKIDYLQMELGYLREKLEAQDSIVLVAMAKYELAKADLVKKNNVRGASDITVEDFEAQVDDVVAAAKETQTDLSEVRAEVDESKKVWLARREELQQASGGGIGSPWAEDSAQWGGGDQ